MSTSTGPTGSTATTTSLPQHFPYTKAALDNAFRNEFKVYMDLDDKTTKSLPNNDKVKESVLEKNLRISSTAPVNLAIRDASKEIVEFETKDNIGVALKGGLGKFGGTSSPIVRIDLGLDRREVQQLQRKIAEKRDLQLRQLYAQYLRCSPDEPLYQYMPRDEQTPKPDRVKSELRQIVFDKVSQAHKDAHKEVFGRYLNDGQLNDMMDRFDKIQEQFLNDEKFASKQLAYIQESEDQTAEGERLPGVDLDDVAQAKLADKIKNKWTDLLRTRESTKADEKESRRQKRKDGLKLGENKAEKAVRNLENQHAPQHAPVAPSSPIKDGGSNVAGPSGIGPNGHYMSRADKRRQKGGKNRSIDGI